MATTPTPRPDGIATIVDRLHDPELLGAILGDVVKVGTNTGRGARGLPDVRSGVAKLRGFLDRYQVVPFPEAFRLMTNYQSNRAIAARTGLSRSNVQRLLAGAAKPTLADMEQIAGAYGHPPTWFAEYRAAIIAASVAAYLEANPERSAALASKLLT